MKMFRQSVLKISAVVVMAVIVALASPLLTLAQAGNSTDVKKFMVRVDAAAGRIISESQLMAFENQPEGIHQVSLLEEFRSPNQWFLSMQARNRTELDAYLAVLQVTPDQIIESVFVNSPELGGGPKAGDKPREGHKVYMIQRSIPGIGLAPLEKKIAVSIGSQKIIDSLGGTVEWDHSFLTSEGTYCVYRGRDQGVIKEHAEIAGIPADPITEVEHIVRNYEF